MVAAGGASPWQNARKRRLPHEPRPRHAAILPGSQPWGSCRARPCLHPLRRCRLAGAPGLARHLRRAGAGFPATIPTHYFILDHPVFFRECGSVSMQIIDIESAKALGLSRYFTGVPCAQGHVSERYVRGRDCAECVRVYKAKWKKQNPDKVKSGAARYRAANKEKIGITIAAWAKNNPDRVRAAARRFRERNLELCRAKTNEWRRKARKENPVFQMQERIRNSVKQAVRRRGYTTRSSASKILGCTWPEFAKHIELQFLPGMSWENRDLWQIDHITPIASAKTEEEVIALYHFTNLRPMWAADNLKKRAKITHLL